MKKIAWDEDKQKALSANASRNFIDFEDIETAILNGKLLYIIQNPSLNHPSQKMFIVEIDNYVYCVPYVENETEYFLKTVFPSRKLTAKYIKD